IGIAGGSNLYAFADGAPLVAGDLFGLTASPHIPGSGFDPDEWISRYRNPQDNNPSWLSQRLDIARQNLDLYAGFPKEFGRWVVQNHHIPTAKEAGDVVKGQVTGGLEGLSGTRGMVGEGNEDFERGRTLFRSLLSGLRLGLSTLGLGQAPDLALA